MLLLPPTTYRSSPHHLASVEDSRGRYYRRPEAYQCTSGCRETRARGTLQRNKKKKGTLAETFNVNPIGLICYGLYDAIQLGALRLIQLGTVKAIRATQGVTNCVH